MKTQLKQLAILILFLFFFTGCSTYSIKECKKFDWETKGSQAALSGQTHTTGFNYYDKTCFDDNYINVDPQAFKRGYEKGLNTYCSKKFGYIYGATGRRYNNTCNKEKEVEFIEGYIKGLTEFNRESIKLLNENVEQISEEVQNLTTKLNSIKV